MKEKEYLIHWSEIEPLCVLRFVKKNLWMILCSALIGVMGVSIAISLLFPPKYASSVTFVVNSRAVSTLHSTNITAAAEVAAAYSQLLQGSFSCGNASSCPPYLPASCCQYLLGKKGCFQHIGSGASQYRQRGLFCFLKYLSAHGVNS